LIEHPHYASDRYSYVPGILWSVFLAALLFKLWRQPKTFAAATAVLLALIAILGTMSVRQTRIWRNSVSLFEYTLAVLGNDPYRADIHWRLGREYARQHKLDKAINQYRLTLALGSYDYTRRLLAQALEAQGKLDEALDQYRQVLQQRPDAQMHGKIGELLAARGRIQEAIAHYREALRLQPGLWPVLNNLALILATDPDPANRNGRAAVQFAEQACAATGQRVAGVVGTLAAAYAEAGRFREAVATAQRARDLAQAVGDGKLADRNRELLQFYESGRPFHEKKTPPKASERKHAPGTGKP
jgi:tetratricopeptide (TPR) repeat protein